MESFSLTRFKKLFSFFQTEAQGDGPPEGYDPFPRSDFMKQFKQEQKEKSDYPAAPTCILEMVNSQLKVSDVMLCAKVDHYQMVMS